MAEWSFGAVLVTKAIAEVERSEAEDKQRRGIGATNSGDGFPGKMLRLGDRRKRRGGRVVYCNGLENRRTAGYREFESHPLRQN